MSGYSYRCDVCGSSVASTGTVQHPLRCWRADCPGGRRPRSPAETVAELRALRRRSRLRVLEGGGHDSAKAFSESQDSQESQEPA